MSGLLSGWTNERDDRTGKHFRSPVSSISVGCPEKKAECRRGLREAAGDCGGIGLRFSRRVTAGLNAQAEPRRGKAQQE